MKTTTAFDQFQQNLREQVLAMWPDKLPPELAGQSREDLKQLMDEVSKYANTTQGALPRSLSSTHRFFVDFGQRRYRDFLGLGAMLLKVRATKTDTEFKGWIAMNVAPAHREEVELAMRAAQEADQAAR